MSVKLGAEIVRNAISIKHQLVDIANIDFYQPRTGRRFFADNDLLKLQRLQARAIL